MTELDELLQTLTTCRRALGPNGAAVHRERLDWIEQVLRAVVPDDVFVAFEGRKRGGDHAQRTHQMLCRLTVEHTTDLIGILDDTGQYLYASPSHAQILGYGQAFLMNASIFGLIHPDHLMLASQCWEDMREAGQAQATLRIRHAKGVYRWFDLRFTVARRGRSTQVIMVARDITDQKHIEADARASEERFQLLIESVKDYAIFMLDPAGYVLNWNRGAERIHGYQAEEIIGQAVSRFYSAQAVAENAPAAALQLATAMGEAVDEGARVRKDGSTFYAQVTTSVLRDGYGAVRGFAVVTRVLTEHRNVDQQPGRHDGQYWRC
jgi:two-component system, NtrC family, sensor kinase